MAELPTRTDLSPATRLQYAVTEPVHLAAVLIALGLLVVTGSFSMLALGILVVLEAIYLFGFGLTVPYARRVRLKELGKVRERHEAEQTLRAAKLNRDIRRRYQALAKGHAQAIAQLESGDLGVDGQLLDRGRLDELRDAALEFCLASQQYRDLLKDVDLAELRGTLDSDPDRDNPAWVAQEKRLNHLEEVARQQVQLDVQLQTIEQAFIEMANLAVQGGLPESVATLTREVDATRRTIREMQALERT